MATKRTTKKSEYNEYQARVERHNGKIIRSKSLKVIEEQRKRLFDLLLQNVTKGIVADESLWPRSNKFFEIADRYISNIEKSDKFMFDWHSDLPYRLTYYEKCEYAK